MNVLNLNEIAQVCGGSHWDSAFSLNPNGLLSHGAVPGPDTAMGALAYVALMFAYPIAFPTAIIIGTGVGIALQAAENTFEGMR